MKKIILSITILLFIGSCEDNEGSKTKYFEVSNVGTCDFRIADNCGILASNIGYDNVWITAGQSRTFTVPDGMVPKTCMLYYHQFCPDKRLVWENDYTLVIYSDG